MVRRQVSGIALDDSDQVHIAYENQSYGRLMSMVIADGLGATEKVAQVGTHGYGMGFAVEPRRDAPELLQRFRLLWVPAVRNQERLVMDQRNGR